MLHAGVSVEAVHKEDEGDDDTVEGENDLDVGELQDAMFALGNSLESEPRRAKKRGVVITSMTANAEGSS